MYCTPSCHNTAMVLASSTRSPMVWTLRRRAASTRTRTWICSCGSDASPWMMVPSIFTESSGTDSSNAALAQGGGERGHLWHVAGRALLGALEAQPLRLGAARAQVIIEPLHEARIAHRFPREPHEQAFGLFLRRERQRCPHHPAI